MSRGIRDPSGIRDDRIVGVNLLHQALIVHRALEAHLGLAPLARRAHEVAIHGAVAADVTEAWELEPRSPIAPDEDEQAVRLERDHAPAAEQLREPEAAEQRRDLARIVQRS